MKEELQLSTSHTKRHRDTVIPLPGRKKYGKPLGGANVQVVINPKQLAVQLPQD